MEQAVGEGLLVLECCWLGWLRPFPDSWSWQGKHSAGTSCPGFCQLDGTWLVRVKSMGRGL